MSDYNNNRQYYQNNRSDHGGRRYRGDSDYGGNFDVDESVINHIRYPQNGCRQPQYRQSYDRRPQPQYRQNYDRRPQPYRQVDNRGYYRSDAYGDSYQYDDRRRGYYDDRYDYAPPGPPKRRSSGVVTGVRVVAIILLIAGLGIVGYKLYNYYIAAKGHSELAALSADFDQLSSMNSDFFGWLKIEDTVIDYPVMYSPDEPERYLHMDFNGDYSDSGELFMDASSDPSGYHYLIYGHHMNDGSMFGSLPKYKDADYLSSHRTFRFDTLYEKGEYEVFAVFYSQVYDEGEDVFKYYNYPNLNDESTYNYYIQNVKSMSVADTGVTPVYGEKIVTLSTCNYHTEDGRFVVCARKIN